MDNKLTAREMKELIYNELAGRSAFDGSILQKSDEQIKEMVPRETYKQIEELISLIADTAAREGFMAGFDAATRLLLRE